MLLAEHTTKKAIGCLSIIQTSQAEMAEEKQDLILGDIIIDRYANGINLTGSTSFFLRS